MKGDTMAKKSKEETKVSGNILTINKKEFDDFLVGVSLRGQNLINEGIMDITKDNILCSVISPNKTIGVIGNLKGKFLTLGKLGVDNFTLLKDSLSLVDGDIVSFDVLENKLSLSTKKSKINLVLRKLEYIKNSIPEDKLKDIENKSNGNEFTLKVEDIQNISKYCNLVKPKVLDILLKGKTLQIIGDNNDNQFSLDVDVAEEVKEAKTKIVTEFLLDIFSVIKNDITISLNPSPNPIKITTKTDNLLISYFVAPIGD